MKNKKDIARRKEVLSILSKDDLIDLVIKMQFEKSTQEKYVSLCKNKMNFFYKLQQRKLPTVHENMPYSSRRMIKQEI